MMKVRAGVLGIATAACFGAAAHAADMPDNWSYSRPEPRFVEMVSGWYLRGDAGYRFNGVSSFEAPTNTITDAKYTSSLGLTFGAGYKYQWFRSDVTLDYAPRVGIDARSTAGASQPQYSMKIAALSLLANLYIDMGTWWGFTPYIGGGVGVSYLQGRDYTDTTLAVNHAVTNDRTNFAWAAMAGVSYRLSPRWLVDVGYRHLNLGDMPATTGTNLASDRTLWKGLSADEIRVGVRFILD